MSTSLAISAVSAVLRDVLVGRFASPPIAAAIGAVTVSVLPPDRVDLSGANDPNQVNLFLHQVSRNLGWANAELPARDAGGRRSNTPPLVLDLHYLVTVFGNRPFFSEMLLGEIAHEFHERPVLARGVIERALAPVAPPPGFPAELAQSGLAEQIERIRIVPENVSAEDISRLWSALQARYRTTLAYQVTTVIIESTASGRAALPVTRRLGTALPVSVPQIEQVRAAEDERAPILPGGEVHLIGRELTFPDVVLEISGEDVSALVAAVEANRITLTLPEPLPPRVYPGVTGAQVIHLRPLGDPPVLHQSAESNLATFVLRPRASATATINDTETIGAVDYRNGTLTIQFTTPVARRQRIEVLLNPIDPSAAGARAYRLRAPDGNGLPANTVDALSIDVPFRRIAAGVYLFRVRVDGAESVLAVDPVTGRFNSPTVAL